MNNEEKIIEKDLSILAKSSIFVFVAVLLSKIFTYLYRIIIARFYGPEIYGLFSLAIMVFGFFIAFATLGLSEGLVRFIPKYRAKKEKEKIKSLVNFSNKLLLISGIVSAILLYFSSEFISINIFHNSDLILYLKIFSFLIPIQLFSGLYFAIIRSHEKINVNSFGLHILQNFVKFIFIAFFIFIVMSSTKAVTSSYFLGIFIGLIFSYIYCKTKLPYVFLKSNLIKNDSFSLRKKLFFYSWPLVLFTIIGTLMFWLDTFLLGYFNDAYLVGIYNAAIPIAALLGFSSDIFMQMFFPLITREFSSKNFIVVKELSKQVTKWIFMINLPITILILFFPGVFINFFFGADYLPAINALRLLVLGQFVSSMSIIPSNLLLSIGKSKIILVNLIFVSIINFILNWNLIPKYGINGAAFATLVSIMILFFAVILENYYFNKIFPFRRKMFPIFLISLILSGILYWASNFVEVNLIWMISLGLTFVLFYLFLILLTKSFDKNDLGIIKRVFRR